MNLQDVSCRDEDIQTVCIRQLEAKEHVKVKRESKTLATITFQNFFNKFEKKAGMTGTALTEEKEFREIYNMDVVEVPTNRPIARVDLEDAVYKTKKANSMRLLSLLSNPMKRDSRYLLVRLQLKLPSC